MEKLGRPATPTCRNADAPLSSTTTTTTAAAPRIQAKGHLRGKQPKLTRRQEAHLVSLLASGEYSIAEVAELFGVGRSTVYRAIERQRDHALVVEIASDSRN